MTIRDRNRRRSNRDRALSFPDRAQRRYESALESIQDKRELLVWEALRPILERMQARLDREKEGSRLDAPEDVALRQSIEGLDLVLGEEEASLAASEAAESISTHNARELGRVMGIDPTSVSDQSTTDAFIRDNVALITRTGRRMKADIRRKIQAAIREGVNPRELTAIIEERMRVSRSRARLIARDQIGKLQGQINRERQQAAGVTHYRWITANDERVRGRKTRGGAPVGQGRHWQLHNTTQAWNSPPVVTTPKGGSRREHPGGDYQCRCQAVPVIDFDAIGRDRPEEDVASASRVPTAPLLPETGLTPPRVPPPRPVAPRRPLPRQTRTVRATPRSLTPFVETQIQSLLFAGRPVRLIANSVGVSQRTVRLVAQRIGLTFAP